MANASGTGVVNHFFYRTNLKTNKLHYVQSITRVL